MIRYMRRPALSRLWLLIFLAVSLPSRVFAGEYAHARVIQAYDGDTIQVRIPSGRKEKVRFIGIDCPEAWENEKFARDMRHEEKHTAVEVLELGRKAKEFTETFCAPGSDVLLEMDAEERDRYGRLLAYVWVMPRTGAGAQGEHLMLNRELLRAGLARLMTIPPNLKYLEDFRNIERWARDNRKGIWSK